MSNCRNVLVKVGHDNVFDAVYRDFEAKKQPGQPGRKGSFSKDYYRTSYLVLGEFYSLSLIKYVILISVFKLVELEDTLPITPLNDLT